MWKPEELPGRIKKIKNTHFLQPHDYFSWLAPEDTVNQTNTECSGDMGISIAKKLSCGNPSQGKTNRVRSFYKTRLKGIDRSSE